MSDEGHHYTWGAPKNGWPQFNEKGKRVTKTAYVAGPMRGYDQFNFPAFDTASAWLREQGWEVFSPAEHDRETGFDETLNSIEGFDLRKAFQWDLETILYHADAIIMLPGWEKSSGVTKAELPVAQTVGLEVYEIVCLNLPKLSQLTAEQVQSILDDVPNSAYDRGRQDGYDDGYADGYSNAESECD